MKLTFFVLALALTLSTAATAAEQRVRSTSARTYAELCYFKQVALPGYAYVNVIGNCGFDVALNPLRVRIVAVTEAREVQTFNLSTPLSDVRSVAGVNGMIQINGVQEDLNSAGDIVRARTTIMVRTLNRATGVFGVSVR